VDRIRAAAFAGEVGASRGGDQRHLVLVLDQILGTERDRAVTNILDNIDAILVEPFADDVETNVGLVLVIRHQHLDFDVRVGRHELLYRLTHAGHRGRPRDVAVDSRHVGDHTDANGLCGLGKAEARRRDHGGCEACCQESAAINAHCSLLLRLWSSV
jgi:hypothetical protein